jgi:hypothetical protein
VLVEALEYQADALRDLRLRAGLWSVWPAVRRVVPGYQAGILPSGQCRNGRGQLTQLTAEWHGTLTSSDKAFGGWLSQRRGDDVGGKSVRREAPVELLPR